MITETTETAHGYTFTLKDNGGAYCDIYCDGVAIDTLGAWDYANDCRAYTASEMRQQFAEWLAEDAAAYVVHVLPYAKRGQA